MTLRPSGQKAYGLRVQLFSFCVALIDFIRLVILRFSDNRYAGLWKFWWLLLATALIGGLLLVVLFDMSPIQYRYHRPSWLAEIFGDPGRYEKVQRSSTDWVMQGHHRIGFQLFVSGFFLSAISLAWAEFRWGLRFALPTTAYLLLLSAAFSIWLFFTQTSVAGIPQRALLLLIFIWVFRSLTIISRRPHVPLGQ